GCPVGRAGDADARRRGARARPLPCTRHRSRHGAGRVSRSGGRPPCRACGDSFVGPPGPRRPPRRRRRRGTAVSLVRGTPSAVHTVLKIGGGLLGKAGAFELTLEAVTAFRPGRHLVVVPGGGPFADAVREVIKRAYGEHKRLVDSHFLRTLPSGVEHLIVTADDLGQLDVALGEGPDRERGRRADQAP